MPTYRGCEAGLDVYMGDGRGAFSCGSVYRILEIYEFYEYQFTHYNPETGEVGLFVDYINTF